MIRDWQLERNIFCGILGIPKKNGRWNKLDYTQSYFNDYLQKLKNLDYLREFKPIPNDIHEINFTEDLKEYYVLTEKGEDLAKILSNHEFYSSINNSDLGELTTNDLHKLYSDYLSSKEK